MEQIPIPIGIGVISFVAWLAYLAKKGNPQAKEKLEDCERFWRRNIK